MAHLTAVGDTRAANLPLEAALRRQLVFETLASAPGGRRSFDPEFLQSRSGVNILFGSGEF